MVCGGKKVMRVRYHETEPISIMLKFMQKNSLKAIPPSELITVMTRPLRIRSLWSINKLFRLGLWTESNDSLKRSGLSHNKKKKNLTNTQSPARIFLWITTKICLLSKTLVLIHCNCGERSNQRIHHNFSICGLWRKDNNEHWSN